jgi:hypothetical protein
MFRFEAAGIIGCVLYKSILEGKKIGREPAEMKMVGAHLLIVVVGRERKTTASHLSCCLVEGVWPHFSNGVCVH